MADRSSTIHCHGAANQSQQAVYAHAQILTSHVHNDRNDRNDDRSQADGADANSAAIHHQELVTDAELLTTVASDQTLPSNNNNNNNNNININTNAQADLPSTQNPQLANAMATDSVAHPVHSIHHPTAGATNDNVASHIATTRNTCSTPQVIVMDALADEDIGNIVDVEIDGHQHHQRISTTSTTHNADGTITIDGVALPHVKTIDQLKYRNRRLAVAGIFAIAIVFIVGIIASNKSNQQSGGNSVIDYGGLQMGTLAPSEQFSYFGIDGNSTNTSTWAEVVRQQYPYQVLVRDSQSYIPMRNPSAVQMYDGTSEVEDEGECYRLCAPHDAVAYAYIIHYHSFVIPGESVYTWSCACYPTMPVCTMRVLFEPLGVVRSKQPFPELYECP